MGESDTDEFLLRLEDMIDDAASKHFNWRERWGCMLQLEAAAAIPDFHNPPARAEVFAKLSDRTITEIGLQLAGHPFQAMLKDWLLEDGCLFISKSCVDHGEPRASRCVETGRSLLTIAHATLAHPLARDIDDRQPLRLAALGFGLQLHGLQASRSGKEGAQRGWCKICFRPASAGSHHDTTNGLPLALCRIHRHDSTRENRSLYNRAKRVWDSLPTEKQEDIRYLQASIDTEKAEMRQARGDPNQLTFGIGDDNQDWKAWLTWLLGKPNHHRVAAISKAGVSLLDAVKSAPDWHSARRILRARLDCDEYSQDVGIWKTTLDLAEGWLYADEVYGDTRKAAGAETVSKIRARAAEGLTRAEIARALGLSRMTVTDAVNRDPWLTEHFAKPN